MAVWRNVWHNLGAQAVEAERLQHEDRCKTENCTCAFCRQNAVNWGIKIMNSTKSNTQCTGGGDNGQQKGDMQCSREPQIVGSVKGGPPCLPCRCACVCVACSRIILTLRIASAVSASRRA
eukprot:366124-Chlamydomonas_euryale.AAC.22